MDCFRIALLALAPTWLLLSSATAHAQVSYSLKNEQEVAAEERIEAALAKRDSFSFDKVPLSTVVADLATRSGITIVLTKQVEDVGIAPDHPVSLAAQNVPLRSALRLMLGNLNLSYMVRDEILRIAPVDGCC